MIISAIVVFKQVDYLHNKDLGLNKEEIMFFPMRGDNMFKNVEAFKNELLKSPGVASVSIGYGFPVMQWLVMKLLYAKWQDGIAICHTANS
jgi:putative ABC transport system permease protein